MEETVESVRNLFKNKYTVKFIQPCRRESKNGSHKSRLLVITDYRIFFLLKSPLCVEKFFYLIDIKGLECLSQERLVINSWSKTVAVLSESGFVQAIKEILICLKKINCSLPAQYLVPKLVMPSPQIAVDTLTYVDKMSVEKLPCGNFSTAYRCMCDFFTFPCLEDVVWDVEAIYFLHDSKEFSFRDFDYIDSRYYLPILSALYHNSYFTGLNLSNIKMVQSNLTELSKILRHNNVLKYLNLSNASLKTIHLEKICEALSLNSKPSISFLDLSKNNLDDRSIQNLSVLHLNWEGLNLSETSPSHGAIVTLFTALSENADIFKTLTYLDLSKNIMKKDGSVALFNFLSHPNSIEKLSLEFCEIPLDICFDHLLKGCTRNLQELNLSGSLVNKKKLTDAALMKWREFFSSAQKLKVLALNHCNFSTDALKSVLLGLAVNTSMADLELKLAGNSFDSKSLDVFEVCLPMLSKVTSLDLSGNSFVADDFRVLFDKLVHVKKLKKLSVGKNLLGSKSKNNEVAVEAIVNYLKNDDLVLECLNIDEMSLRSEAFLFLNHLGGDTRLRELNISGNYIGPAGACLLSKSLQINCMLKKIVLDRNDFNIPSLNDIAHALSRNYFLKSIPLPFFDIMNIQKLNPEKMDRLEEVVRKIEFLINRNNSPSLLLADKTFASKLSVLKEGQVLNDLLQATKSLQNIINKMPGTRESQILHLVEDAKILLKESHLFIKTFKEYHSHLKEKGSTGETADRQLMSLIQKLRSYSSASQIGGVQSLVEYLTSVFPKNYELFKEKVKFDGVKLQDILLSPTLCRVVGDSEQTLNAAVPYVVLELLKMVSDLLISNLGEFSDILMEASKDPDNINLNDLLRYKNTSALLANRKSILKEEFKGLTDSMIEESGKRTLRPVRPKSTFVDPEDLYLPVSSESLEHLVLQRPKQKKKNKPTVAAASSPQKDDRSTRSPKPLPRRLSLKDARSPANSISGTPNDSEA